LFMELLHDMQAASIRANGNKCKHSPKCMTI
jgi:hypothetical protein